jgi:hypothetical protein
MNNDCKNTITINLTPYLAEFLKAFSESSPTEPVRLSRNSYFGNIIYRLIDKVPEDCRYIEPVIKNKTRVKLMLGWLGDVHCKRKNPYSYFYFPRSRQIEFEESVKALFDNLFFNVIEITKEYTDAQYVQLIENFCKRYRIDFATYFDTMKKKHYRERIRIANSLKKC